MKQPPRLARLLLRLLPSQFREPIVGDLYEEWQAAPSARKFWALTIQSLAACLGARLRPPEGESMFRRASFATLMQDARYALRILGRSPAFSAAVILTMAVGIGATTAIFSLVHAVLLRPLPFRAPEQLVRIYTVSSSERRSDLNLSPANYASLSAATRSLSSVALYTPGETTLTRSGEPRRLAVARVSAGFFETLGVAPLAGQTFRPDDNRKGQNVAVLGESLAGELFGSPSDALGRTIVLDDVTRAVVGVLPRSFNFPDEPAVWLPREFDASYTPTSAAGRAGGWLPVIARRAPGSTLEQVRAELATLGGHLQTRFPSSNSGVSFTAVPLHSDLVGSVRTPLLLLLAAVALVLLIVCANVSGLLLARATTRREELAVRRALGAGSGRIVRQLLIEALVLSTIAGTAGLLPATWSAQMFVRVSGDHLPRVDGIHLDGMVLGFSIVLTLAVGILVGVSPAMRAGRVALAEVLRAGGRSGPANQHGASTRRGLVVVEIALAVVVLTAAGLVLRGLRELIAVDPGFNVDRVVSFRVDLPVVGYSDEARVRSFYADLVQRLDQAAGIESVAVASRLPLSGRLNTSFFFEGESRPVAGSEQYIEVRAVTPRYFSAMGLPLVAGRSVEPADAGGGVPVGVISVSGARGDAAGTLGRRIRIGVKPGAIHVVGVVGDVRHLGLDRDVSPHLYIPFDQAPTRTAFVVVRARSDHAPLMGEIRAHLTALDPRLPSPELIPLRQLVATATAGPRFVALLLTAFALLALGLAAVGIFALFSFDVAQRTREIGVRVALGADPAGIVRLVMRNALVVTLTGILIGVLAVLPAGRLLQSQLFRVSASDPLTLSVVVAVLTSVALAASFVPARRAASIDPLVALRSE